MSQGLLEWGLLEGVIQAVVWMGILLGCIGEAEHGACARAAFHSGVLCLFACMYAA